MYVEGLRPSDPNSGNPEQENMNNFYCNMPGGNYRLEADVKTGPNFIGMVTLIEEYAQWLSKPEEYWPVESKKEIRVLKVTLEIQESIDDFLTENPELLVRWNEFRPISGGGLPHQLDEILCRPVYKELRKRFSQNDLVG